jgi:hypothetical protein
LDEVLEEQNKAFSGANVYHYYPVSTSIPVVTDPIDNSGLTMNTETNASVLASAISTPASPGHIHTGDCFSGHMHTAACKPMGKANTEVYVDYFRSYNWPNYTTTISIRCVACRQLLYSCNFNYTDNSFTSYSVNASKYGYDSFGNWVQSEKMQYNNYGKDNTTQQTAVQTLGSLFYTYATAPGIQSRDSYSSGESIRSKNYIWGYGDFPWLTNSGYTTTPYLGCCYCGKYGENWTCGHNEVGVGHEHGINASYYALHKHTDACFAGTLCTGYDYNGDGYFHYGIDALQSSYAGDAGDNGTYSLTNYYCRGCGKSVHIESSSRHGSGSRDEPHGISKLNPICGKTGTYSDLKTICYAPKIKLVQRHDYYSAAFGSWIHAYTLTCDNCSNEMYTLSYIDNYNNSYYPDEITLSIRYGADNGYVTGLRYSITSTTAGYQDIYNAYVAFTNQVVVGAVTDPNQTNTYYIDAGKASFSLPWVGQFNGCPACNDFKIRRFFNGYSDGSSSAALIITCLHCNKEIVRAYPDSNGSYRHFSLYKNGILQETITTNYGDTTPYRQFLDAARDPQNVSGVTLYNRFSGSYGSLYSQIQEANVPYNYYAFIYSFLNPYINHGCAFVKKTYCNMGSSPKLCSQVVASITPTHPVQSVYTNEPLITTVTATYLDGSKRVVLANTTFSTANPITNKVVTLTYQDSTGKTHTCTITVNVIPRNKTCVNGHTYNLNNDGSDPGCPYCKAWLRSLIIEFPTTPYFTIYRGTTLPENGVTLIATYLDGHTELLESEYIDNLDRYYVGSQSVTMSYKGHYVYLTVVTRRNLKLCTVCHRQYELHPDDSDPGCPWCAALTPIFTGNVMEYFSMNYSEEILEELYEGDGIYRFSDDDFLIISVRSRRGSVGTRLLSSFYLSGNVNTVHVIKAGSIREDGYYYKHQIQ